MLLDKALEYFTTFSEKDTEGLKSMFSDDVILRDWEIIANGIDEVVDANQNIFDSIHSIKAEVKDIGYNDNKVYAELIIKVVEKKLAQDRTPRQ